MNLFIDNKSGAPIYEQLYTQIKNQILSGGTAAGGSDAIHPGAGAGSAHQRYHHKAGLR